MTLILLLLLAGPIRPNPVHTPGVVRDLTQQTICTTRWGVDRRMVTQAMKRQVFKNYGIPWADHGLYEVDHLIPRSLGGADAVANLWPQAWAGDYGARKKDVLEQKLGRKVCNGEITLTSARKSLKNDWIAAYRLFVAEK